MSQYQQWIVEEKENITWLTFDRADSSVNSLNESSLLELSEILTKLSLASKALVICSGKKTGFIVGADITQFKGLSEKAALTLIEKGQAVFNQLENLPMVTIALIDGACLGGGLELALACRYRIAVSGLKTRLGLPEVKLGIHPGWGGTVRLGALVGVKQAMSMILTGRTISCEAAQKIGVVDAVVPSRLIEPWVVHYAMVAPPPKRASWQWLWRFKWIRAQVGARLYQRLAKKVSKAHYPAPFQVVDNWVKWGAKRSQAMTKEAHSVAKLVVSTTSKRLVEVFFLQETLKKLGKAASFAPTKIHVIGAGVMGGDIAAWCAVQGLDVTLQDDPLIIGSAIKRAYALAKERLKEKHLVQQALDRLCPDPKGQGIAKAHVIIEAVTEDLAVKKALFAKVASLNSQAVLATNTSSIPLEEISQALAAPSRLVGIHFFNPVAKMPLIEVVKGKKTDEQQVKKAMAFAHCIGRLPLPVKSAPGFLVNRILLPYLLEAVKLLEEGVAGLAIDAVAVGFGMPMGPVALADAVGLDVCLAALKKLDRDDKAMSLLVDLVEKGDLGKKTGKGFYTYRHGHALTAKVKPAPKDTLDRLLLPLLNEAVACLREGIVENAALLDAACIFGFGFPAFRGGPVTHIRQQDKAQWLALYATFAKRYGDRFKPDLGWENKTFDGFG